LTETAERTLNTLEIGQRARLIQVKGERSACERLLDMIMVPGTVLSLIKKTPLRDPVNFKLKDITYLSGSMKHKRLLLKAGGLI
jgi:ferrous iron transport protein A